MTCWQCGEPLPPDVGFCRACRAFVRPRSAPLIRPGFATGAPQEPLRTAPDVAGMAPASSVPAGLESTPQFSASPTLSISRLAAPAAAWSSSSSTLRPRIASSGGGRNRNISDGLVVVGTAFVLISLLLTWYRVTITPLGVQFFESIERAFLSRLFPQAAAGLGGITGPLTLSVSPLDKAAGGWRWAVLVVSIVILLEVLLAVSSGVTRQPVATWPHSAILLVLTVANLFLVIAAFVDLPYGATPAGYLTVTRGLGAYLGLLAGLVACGGTLAVLVKSSVGEGTR